MSTEDKASNKFEQAKGKVKETVGGATGNDDMKNEGQADQTSGDVKQAGENVKDAFKS